MKILYNQAEAYDMEEKIEFKGKTDNQIRLTFFLICAGAASLGSLAIGVCMATLYAVLYYAYHFIIIVSEIISNLK